MKISIIHSSHKRKVQQLRQIATDLQFTSSEIPKKLGNQQHRLIQIPKTPFLNEILPPHKKQNGSLKSSSLSFSKTQMRKKKARETETLCSLSHIRK